MNVEKYLEFAKELQELTSKVSASLEEWNRTPKPWRAGKRWQYFFIASDGATYQGDENDNIKDTDRYSVFNYFNSKAEAERIERVQLAYRTLSWAMSAMKAMTTNEGFTFMITPLGGLNYHFMENTYSPLPSLYKSEDAEYVLKTYPNELRTFLTGGRE